MSSTVCICRLSSRSLAPRPQGVFQTARARPIIPTPPHRFASTSSKGEKTKKKRKARPTFRQHDTRDAEQFSLCDAMRYCPCFSLVSSTIPELQINLAIQLHPRIRSRPSPNVCKIRSRSPLPHSQKRPHSPQPLTPPSSRQHLPPHSCHLPP